MPIITDGVPRRVYLDLQTRGEVAIGDAMAVIERMGADPLLTDAVVLLQQAKGKVGDYVDRALGMEPRAPIPGPGKR